MKKFLFFSILALILVILLHSTPKLALRTHVFTVCLNPVSAIRTNIVNDTFHNQDKDTMKRYRANSKAYTLTNPPRENDNTLANWIVQKYGFLYFSEYLGDA